MDNNDPLSRIQNTRAEQNRKSEEEKRHGETIGAILASSKNSKDEVTSAIHDLMLATLVAKDPRLVEVSKNLAGLLEAIKIASGNVKNSPLDKLPKIHADLVKALKALPAEVAKSDKSSELIPHLQRIAQAVQSKQTSPTVNVAPPELDLKPLERLMGEVKKAISDIKLPSTDLSELQSSVKDTTKAIQALSFPVPNYVLPFKDASTGKATQVILTSAGALPVDIQDASVTINGDVTVSSEVEVKNDSGNPVPVNGTITANAGTGPFPVSDNSGSLTVDAPVGTPVFVRLSDGSSAIATLPVSMSTVPTHAVTAEKTASSTTSTGVTVGSSSTTVIASNANRKAVIIVNDSDETVYLKYGTGAAANSGIRLNASGGTIREEMYTGVITGICASGGKVVTVTEM